MLLLQAHTLKHRFSMDAKEPHVMKAILLGRCPRCGVGGLFTGYLSVGTQCKQCGLDYAPFDPGDGPAVFGILIGGALLLPSVLWVEFTFEPPWWVHVLIWTPVICIVMLGLLRLTKAALLVLQYRNKAGEGRRSPDGE